MGPLGHKSATDLLFRTIGTTKMPGVLMLRPTILESLGPDITKESHAYDVDRMEGSLDDRIRDTMASLRYWREQSSHDTTALTQLVADLTHYCVDACTVGQVCRDLWGRRDDYIDLVCDLVTDKARFGIATVSFRTEDQGIDLLLMRSRIVAQQYRSSLGHGILTPFGRTVQQHCRDAVSCGAGYAAAFLEVLWQ